VLVTGITGFVGSHLADFLLQQKGVELYGIARTRNFHENIKGIKDRIHLFYCDVLDASRMRNALGKIKPDRIFHLAGQSVVSTCWNSPYETFDLNLVGTLNLFEAAQKLRPQPSIHVAGSAQAYGRV
jgi:GDP-4-dehydro-6-deoxy-D-mannose reductase